MITNNSVYINPNIYFFFNLTKPKGKNSTKDILCLVILMEKICYSNIKKRLYYFQILGIINLSLGQTYLEVSMYKNIEGEEKGRGGADGG